MTIDNCDQARGQLALAAIGKLPENERLSLESHLDGCPQCRSELAHLSGLESALALADPDRIEREEAIPESLRFAVFGSLETEVARERRSMRLKFAAAAAVILIVIGGVFGAVALGSNPSHHSPSGPTFALSGPGGAHGTAQLTAESWGTAVELKAIGGRGGQALTLSMRADDGSWWTAGTYVAVSGAEVDVPMSCAVPVAQINGIRIMNSAGQQIMASYDA